MNVGRRETIRKWKRREGRREEKGQKIGCKDCEDLRKRGKEEKRKKGPTRK